MEPEVVFHRLARADLFGIYSYIEEHGSIARAWRYIERIEAACRHLSTFPEKVLPAPTSHRGCGPGRWNAGC